MLYADKQDKQENFQFCMLRVSVSENEVFR